MSLDPCPKQNLRVKRGTLLRIEIECADDEDNPLNMTGRTCKMQARTTYGGPVLFEADSEAEPATITLTPGLVTVEVLVPADARLVERGVHDIILIGEEGPECIAEGDIMITDKATDLE
jgi:hypothetical protein